MMVVVVNESSTVAAYIIGSSSKVGSCKYGSIVREFISYGIYHFISMVLVLWSAMWWPPRELSREIRAATVKQVPLKP